VKSAIFFSKDLVAGLVFLSIGTGFLWLGLDYHIGAIRQMGPGYFPVSLASLLIALGAVVALKAWRTGGEPISRVNFKGIIFVVGTTALFGLLIRPAGMVMAVFVLTAISALASVRFGIKSAVILAAGLSGFCLIVFIWGLGMPFSVLGYWLNSG
jgi:hypothetical protein